MGIDDYVFAVLVSIIGFIGLSLLIQIAKYLKDIRRDLRTNNDIAEAQYHESEREHKRLREKEMKIF